jgi:prepilin-type N-terminal cleavage/methylation domain-containing protein
MKFQISNFKSAIRNPQRPEERGELSEIRNGYTLPELLVVLALLSVVTGVLSVTIYQFYTVTNWGNAQLTVDADMRNAGLWLVRDGNQSFGFTPGGGCGVFAAPTYTGSISATRYITYTYSSPTLSRQDSGAPGQTIGVARHVTAVQCVPGAATGTVKVTIISTSGKVSNSATFTVTMRVD